MAEPSDETVVARRTSKRMPVVDALAASTPTDVRAAGTHASTRRYTYSSPAETMRAEEMLRARAFLLVVLIMLGAMALVLPVLGGDPTNKLIFYVCMGVTASACAAFLLYIRADDNYTPARAVIPAAITIVGAMGAINYFGFFSPAPMILTFGIYFISQSSSDAVAGGIYVAVALLHTAGSVLQALGVLPDRGVVRVADVEELDRFMIVAAEQLVLGITYALGRLSRRATLTAMERLEQAIRQVGQREALLQEANRDLERALRGGNGRWSGEQTGPWRLGEVIGRGAMGEVYEAQHVQQGTKAAMKLLLQHVEQDADQVRRFLREAEVMSRVDSPHVCKLLDVGMGQAGAPAYIAMELLSGHDLAWHLRKKRRLPPPKVVELVTHLANALTVAHQAEIVHRDLKPQNLFLHDGDGGAPVWKVLDFGVSKLGSKTGTLTRGHVVGTPGYMSPEQARGLPVDRRADIFSMAVIAYRALTGRPAFSGDDYPKIMFDLVYVQPARPTELAQLPIEIDFALALGLAKDPKQRMESAAEFAEALRRALDSDLPRELARRGQELIMLHPWGTRLEVK